MEMPVLFNALDGCDLLALRLAEGRDARADGSAVEQNGAGATLTFAAAVLGPGQVQFIAKHVQDWTIGIALAAVLRAVDDQFHTSIVRSYGRGRTILATDALGSTSQNIRSPRRECGVNGERPRYQEDSQPTSGVHPPSRFYLKSCARIQSRPRPDPCSCMHVPVPRRRVRPTCSILRRL